MTVRVSVSDFADDDRERLADALGDGYTVVSGPADGSDVHVRNIPVGHLDGRVSLTAGDRVAEVSVGRVWEPWPNDGEHAGKLDVRNIADAIRYALSGKDYAHSLAALVLQAWADLAGEVQPTGDDMSEGYVYSLARLSGLIDAASLLSGAVSDGLPFRTQSAIEARIRQAEGEQEFYRVEFVAKYIRPRD